MLISDMSMCEYMAKLIALNCGILNKSDFIGSHIISNFIISFLCNIHAQIHRNQSCELTVKLK